MSDLNKTIDALIESASQMPSTSFSRPVIDSSHFVTTVKTRRSVRVFTGEKLSDEIVNQLLDLAMLAPSSSNLQPWEFHRIVSQEKRQKVIEACLSQPAAKTASELIVVVARKATWKRNRDEILRGFRSSRAKIPKAVFDYYEKLIPRALAVQPWPIMPALKWMVTRTLRYFRVMPQEPVGCSDLRVWAHKSTALAAQTLMLSARAFGLDSCPMEGFDSFRVRKILKLPCDAEITMIVAIGKAKPEGIYGEQYRFDRSWHVFEH